MSYRIGFFAGLVVPLFIFLFGVNTYACIDLGDTACHGILIEYAGTAWAGPYGTIVGHQTLVTESNHVAVTGGYNAYNQSIDVYNIHDYIWNGVNWSATYGGQFFLLPGTTVSSHIDYGCWALYIVDNYPSPYTCPIPPDPCGDAGLDPVADCGSLEFVTWENVDTCEYHCSVCDTEYQQLVSMCGHGIENWDNNTCSGRCTNCEDLDNICKDSCSGHGGVLDQDCFIDNTGSGETSIVTCTCNDEFEPVISDPGDEPPTPIDNDQQPAPAPTIPPEDTPDETSNRWLEAIKSNTDSLVNQGNIDKQYQANIAENQRRTVNNLDAVNQNIQTLGSLQNVTNTKLDNIEAAIKESGGDTAPQNIDFSPLGFDGEVPDVPNFDITLPTEHDYTEYDDSSTLASDEATSTFNDITTDPNNVSPINAQITASSQNACIDGSFTIRGISKPVSICFDRPWMLQGYAIMKVILIGIGYLQSAMLLNRGIAA